MSLRPEAQRGTCLDKISVCLNASRLDLVISLQPFNNMALLHRFLRLNDQVIFPDFLKALVYQNNASISRVKLVFLRSSSQNLSLEMYIAMLRAKSSGKWKAFARG